MRPGLLLLDEPTANLDPQGVQEVRDAVARVLDRTGATLVVVEHRVAVWADVVDRVIVLAAGGGVLADGPPDKVLAERATRARLVEAGVRVPGHTPRLKLPAAAVPGGPLLQAVGLDAARSRKTGPVLAAWTWPCAADRP